MGVASFSWLVLIVWIVLQSTASKFESPSPSAINDELLALVSRLGEQEFEARLRCEEQLRQRRGEGQGRGLIALENVIDFYAWVRLGLKCVGLWSLAQRNYFDIRVEYRDVQLARLPAAFDGFRILQLTDLHADLHPDFPAAVRRAISGLDYDLLVVTGDFRTCTFGDHTGATQASIDILKASTAPCYAILGNHDFLAKVPPMEAAGIRFLLNEHVSLQRDGAVLHLLGIDDPNYYKTHNLSRALAGLPAQDCKLLLSHSPETYREAAGQGIDFQLSGHTHGGQLCLPGGRVLVHDRSAPRHLLSGAWQFEGLQGYTSRGTGASGLPVRLNCPAEVTLHTLRAGGC